MITRRTASRTLVVLGCVLLVVSAVEHCIAYVNFSGPAVRASNLPAPLQSVFEISFLSMAWSQVVLVIIALVVTFAETRLSKPIGLICGFAVLIQAAATVPLVRLFSGNEMLGGAALLIIIGCSLFRAPRIET